MFAPWAWVWGGTAEGRTGPPCPSCWSLRTTRWSDRRGSSSGSSRWPIATCTQTIKAELFQQFFLTGKKNKVLFGSKRKLSSVCFSLISALGVFFNDLSHLSVRKKKANDVMHKAAYVQNERKLEWRSHIENEISVYFQIIKQVCAQSTEECTQPVNWARTPATLWCHNVTVTALCHDPSPAYMDPPPKPTGAQTYDASFLVSRRLLHVLGELGQGSTGGSSSRDSS